MRRQQIVDLVKDLAHPEFRSAIDGAGKIAPEVAQHHFPIHLTGRYRIQPVFEIGSEVIFHVAVEIAFQKGRHQPALVFRHEAFTVQHHIIAILQHGQDRGVGGRAANAQFFQLLDQGGFRIARWRLREMLLGPDLFIAQTLAFGDLGQSAIPVIDLGVVAAFFVQLQKAGKIHHRARGAQVGGTVLGGYVDGSARQTGRFHLRGHGPLPNQVIQALLFIVQIGRHGGRQTGKICRPDGFMGFLGILRLGAVDPGFTRHIVGPEFSSNYLTASSDRLVRHLHAIGPHVCDQADSFAANIETFI